MDDISGDMPTLIKSFDRHLRATNRSPRTRHKYVLAATQLTRFLADEGLPTNAAEVRRRAVEAYIAFLLDRFKPGTALTRYQDLQQLFRWLVDEEEIAESPMAKMRPPTLPEVPVPVLSLEEVKGVLATCDGKAFDDLRDQAVIRMFVDTGMRRSELAYLKVDDVDFEDNVAVVMGKGRRPRACPFGAKTARPRPLPPRPGPSPAGRPSGPVADALRRYDRQRRCTDGEAPRRAGRHRGAPPSPAAAYVRSSLAVRGR